MRPSRYLVGIILALAMVTVILLVQNNVPQNALILVWGALFVATAMDFIISPSRRNMNYRFDVLSDGFVGAPQNSTLSIERNHGRLPSAMEVMLGTSKDLSLLSKEPVLTYTGTPVEIELLPHKRGLHSVNKLYVKWSSSLRLFEIISNIEINKEIKVAPDTRPVSNGTVQTQLLPLVDGIKDFNKQGTGSEFHQMREFVPGMEPRSIDWKRSARFNKLLSREVRAERNHQIFICVDNGGQSSQMMGEITKLDYALNASLALCWAGGLGGDQVGFYNFNASPGRFLPPRPGREAFPLVRARCGEMEYETAETNHTWGLSQLTSQLNRRSLIVIFSDFADGMSAELLVENLTHITKQHLVLFIILDDEDVTRIQHPHDLNFDTMSLAVAASELKNERSRAIRELRNLGILVLNVAPSNLTTELISKYMDIKLGEMI